MRAPFRAECARFRRIDARGLYNPPPMPSTLRRTLVALLFCLFASWAWHPLFAHGLRAEELALVSALGELKGLDACAGFQPLGGHVLGVALSSVLARVGDGESAVLVWRAHHVLAVLIAAWLLGRFLRRLATPWVGGELARACGWTASMLFALHPLTAEAIGAARAAGLLWALVGCFASVWCLLKARQEREPRLLWASGALVALASLFHGAALAAPLWLAASEYASSSRHRPQRARWRAAGAVFGLAALCVGLDSLVRSLARGVATGPAELVAAWRAFGDPLELAAVSIERLGMLLLAVNAQVLGAAGFALAGVAALATLQPMMIAARAAPRLWGWILVAFLVGVLSTELVSPHVRVHPHDLRDADTLLASAAAIAAAGAVAITSLTGAQRIVSPLVVALAYCVLGHGAAVANRHASREVAALVRELREPGERPVLVDAPRVVLGVRAFEGGPWSCADVESFTAWLASDVSDSARERGDRWLRRRRSTEHEGVVEWASAKLRPRAAGGVPITWLREGRSPELAADPLEFGAVVATLEAEVDAGRSLVLAWRTADREGRSEFEGSCAGAWSYVGESPEAVFDLESSLDWLASSEVRLIWSESGWSRIDSAQLTTRLPEPPFDARPTMRGDDWRFAARDASRAGAPTPREYVLVLCDLDSFETLVLPARIDGADLVIDDAQGAARELRATGPAAWALEARVDGLAVERARGRIGD